MSRPNTAVQRWRKIIREQQASGLSIAAYCRRTGLAAWSLYFWRRRLSASRRVLPASMCSHKLPRRRSPAGRRRTAKFVEVKATQRNAEALVEGRDLGAGRIELHLPGRRCVMVRPGFDQPTLLALLHVLEANPARAATEEADI